MGFLALGLALGFFFQALPIQGDDRTVSAIAIGARAPDKSSLRDLRGNRRPLYGFKDNRALVLAFLGAALHAQRQGCQGPLLRRPHLHQEEAPV
jgi:hypothetical protein